METIYMLVLFFGPGLMVKAMDEFVYKTRKQKISTYDYVFEVVAHSIVVFAILNILYAAIVRVVNVKSIQTVSELLERMDSLSFMAAYLALCTLTGLAWWHIYNTWAKRLLNKARNRKSKKLTGTQHNEYASVYEGIFHNQKIMSGEYVVVSIWQNGKAVTSGLITGFNSPNSDITEYQLEYTDEIKEILDSDKTKTDDEKILFYTNLEYYNPSQNLLIKFYRPNRLAQHWARHKEQ
jgi:hypothetical protein